MKKIIKFIVLIVTYLGFGSLLFGQNLTINGKITDTKLKSLVAVSISIKDKPGFGTQTNREGEFKIQAGPHDILIITMVGYEKKEVPVDNNTFLQIELQETSNTGIDEVTVMAAGTTQRKITVTGAVTTVNVKDLKTSSGQLSNALAGNVAGIIARQISGEPGANVSEFWIRGINTFGANAAALVLVDGIERKFNEINIEDIASFSVLKDASATAIYGQRGANGVIIITTKQGEAGKAKINMEAIRGYNTRSRTANYVDGITYMNLANEAKQARFQNPLFSDVEKQILSHQLDPDLYPNVNWWDYVLKDGAKNQTYRLNIAGGGSTARYFISGAYYNEDGMYKTDDVINTYNTNVNYGRYNYRANVDVNVTKTTLVRLGVSGFLTNQNRPGTNTGDIWGSLSEFTPLTIPVKYSNGSIPTYGTGNRTNPWVLLTQTGYSTRWENNVQTNVSLEQDLTNVLSGLRFVGRFAFDTYNDNVISRTKGPDMFRAERLRDRNGDIVMRRVKTATPLAQTSETWGNRRYYTEANLSYTKLIAQQHNIGGLLLFYQQDISETANVGSDVLKGVPKRNVALSGRVTYGFKDRYLTEFNFGYTGSENFEKRKRFGFFPAISGGWVISEEPFIKDNLPWIDLLKVRYSYGEVGNDKLNGPDGKELRFPYISTFSFNSSGYTFGEYGSNVQNEIYESLIGTPNLTWEVSKKNNLGFDFTFLNNKITATIDVFRDHRMRIFMPRRHMPQTVGLYGREPMANVGEMLSKGIDASFMLAPKIGSIDFTIRGNITYSNSKVLEYDEAANALPYQMTKGYRWRQTRGLIVMGLFKDYEDIENSPKQTFGGTLLPGDIKYKDVNGDGIIDSKDEVPLGSTTVPNIIYGLGMSATWKDFSLSFLLQGSGKSDFFIGGNNVHPFATGDIGNVLAAVANDGDRWIPSEISGSPGTENPNALFPRLSYNGNANNFRNSTFWLRDGSYLRLKNVDVNYALPKALLSSLKISAARVYLRGDNLYVWSKFKWWDPEIGTSDGRAYPISKTLTLGLRVEF
ncbi:SusC/RagA family TonB-linked outer membrane protein [Sphingobacterium sp. Mn56C]|uniref:SusC/RagA family TonB-linked outer membrane protein n=1 Tax=Sphingobacterium sp. Mn56C TaxID=3395261 RepID=UPI003BDB6B68